LGGVGEVAGDYGCASRDFIALTSGKIVEDGHGVTFG